MSFSFRIRSCPSPLAESLIDTAFRQTTDGWSGLNESGLPQEGIEPGWPSRDDPTISDASTEVLVLVQDIYDPQTIPSFLYWVVYHHYAVPAPSFRTLRLGVRPDQK